MRGLELCYFILEFLPPTQHGYEEEKWGYLLPKKEVVFPWVRMGLQQAKSAGPCLKLFILVTSETATMYQFIYGHLLTSICFALHAPKMSLFFVFFVLATIMRNLLGFMQKIHFIVTVLQMSTWSLEHMNSSRAIFCSWKSLSLRLTLDNLLLLS